MADMNDMNDNQTLQITSEPASQANITGAVGSSAEHNGMAGQMSMSTTPIQGGDVSMTDSPAPSPSPARRTSTRIRRTTSINGSPASGDASMNGDQMSDIRESTASSTTSTTKSRGDKRPRKPLQRFVCTDYAPCQLSFTRSEHLARHIRKHTGERPFACHCERKFSRLDNLRQHAQTVHSNEVIPEGSLALSGGNFRKTRNGGGVIPAAQRARDIQMRQDSPGRHHVAVPGRGSHGWVPGHRRGAHSMPVNQMQPMYTSQTDPRTGYHYPHMENPSTRGSVYPHPEEAYHAGPYTPPSNRSSGIFESYHPSQMPSPAYSHGGEQRFPPQRRQSISGGIGPYQQPPHFSRGPQLPPLQPVRETHTRSQIEYDPSPASSRFQHEQYEDRRRTWTGGEYPAYLNQAPAVFDPFRDDPRPREPMTAHRPAPISHIDPSLRDSPGSVQLAPIRNLENIQRPRTSHEQETYQQFSMREREREREQHYASPASLAQDVQRMEINHPRQRSIFRDDHGRVFTRDERGDVYLLHEASRPSYHADAPRPSIEDVPRPYFHEEAARPAHHTEEAPRPSYGDDAAADWAAETQKRLDEAREAEARAVDAAAALHDLHQSKR